MANPNDVPRLPRSFARGLLRGPHLFKIAATAMLLFVVVAAALAWMHFAIRRMERAHFPQIGRETDLPEFINAAKSARAQVWVKMLGQVSGLEGVSVLEPLRQ